MADPSETVKHEQPMDVDSSPSTEPAKKKQKLNDGRAERTEDTPVSSPKPPTVKMEPKENTAAATASTVRGGSKHKTKRILEEDDEVDEADLDIPLAALQTNCPSKKEQEVDEDDLDIPLSALTQIKADTADTKPPKKRKYEETTTTTSTPSRSKKTPTKGKEKEKQKKDKKEKKERKKKQDSDDEEENAGKKSRSHGKVKKEDTSDTKKPKKASAYATDEGGEADEEEEEDWKWWEDENALSEGKKWTTLEHHGVWFPPEYVPHGVKMLYDGKPVDLTPEQEEVATYYAKYLGTDHVKKDTFNRNFFKEFLAKLNPPGTTTPHIITDFAKCDFTPIWRHLEAEKERRKTRTKEEREKEKQEKKELEEKYGWALVDGHRTKVGNWKIEPPGLFLGRGTHPKAGMLKARIMPEDVTLNLSKGVEPPPPPPGHSWKAIVHNDQVTWLAFWRENINNAFKYVWLASSSHIKGRADLKKFEVARQLKSKIDEIRRVYTKDLQSDKKLEMQRGTALWIIDHLALRVGNEKGEDEADTVGCCSLRVEHIKLIDPNTVEFDFLGKDSMRYQNSVKVDLRVFKNLKKLVKNKGPKDELFDALTPTALNAHLRQQMPGLTAKVFRTYNASQCLQEQLAKGQFGEDATVEEKVFFYNTCNREVAILCNHQRSLPKKFSEQMGKIDEKIEEIRTEIKAMKRHLKDIEGGKVKRSTKEESEDEDEEESDDELEGGEDSAEKKKKKAAKKMSDNPETLRKQIARKEAQIKKWEIKKEEKDALKTVALGTSKINYIDPRITVAWCKREGVPIEKIFSKTLRDKFPWAMSVDEDWTF